MKLQVSILVCLVFATPLLSQTRVVHGSLTAFNTYSVQNVEIIAKKAGSRIVSDSLGQFDIVCRENDIIKVKSKAFNPVTKKIGPETDSLSINLIFVDTRRNREYAVGYGYLAERDLTYAVSNMQQENNEFCVYANIYELIRGRFAGVTISNNAVFIRGPNSMNSSSEALYVLDGVIVPDIDWITPCSIKSISVMKDGGSAIYGSRGANGVVLIETIK